MPLRTYVDRSKVVRYGATLTTLVLALVWFFTLRPQSLGGAAAYVVVSGVSMQPTYHDGDLVVLRRTSTYHTGNIVAYQVPKGEQGEGSLVIHRITGRDERGYITRGDNRKGDDLWRPKQSDVVGQAWLHLPGAGRLLSRLRAPLPLATLAAMFSVYFVLTSFKAKADRLDPS